MRPRREPWRLAINLSVVAAVGGLLFLVIGDRTSASATFAFGLVCAAIAALLLRRRKG